MALCDWSSDVCSSDLTMINCLCGVPSMDSHSTPSERSAIGKQHECSSIRSVTSQIERVMCLFFFRLDIRFQLNKQLKCLEQRIETQLVILAEIQEYFRRRADVELDYAKNLDNLHKQVGQKHRTQKSRFVLDRSLRGNEPLSIFTGVKRGSFNPSTNYGTRSFRTHERMSNITRSCRTFAASTCSISSMKSRTTHGACS